jgi:hypothetical protein
LLLLIACFGFPFLQHVLTASLKPVRSNNSPGVLTFVTLLAVGSQRREEGWSTQVTCQAKWTRYVCWKSRRWLADITSTSCLPPFIILP